MTRLLVVATICVVAYALLLVDAWLAGRDQKDGRP